MLNRSADAVHARHDRRVSLLQIMMDRLLAWTDMAQSLVDDVLADGLDVTERWHGIQPMKILMNNMQEENNSNLQ